MTLSDLVSKQGRLVAKLQRRLDIEYVMLMAVQELAKRESSYGSDNARKRAAQ